MRAVKSPEEVYELLAREFTRVLPMQIIPLLESFGRVLARDIIADEAIPGFDRSTVDGYAVRAADTFGCSESIPALLKQTATVEIGTDHNLSISDGECVWVPTGGKLPEGADAVVMVEYTETAADCVAVHKAAAIGANYIKRGDDVSPGKTVLKRGHVLRGQDMGLLAALGHGYIPVTYKPRVGIISTGDELTGIEEKKSGVKIRDINTYALYGAAETVGAIPVAYGRCRDNLDEITDLLKTAIDECDLVVISGGSSVGTADLTARAFEQVGKEYGDAEILVHGIALKPGKPTIIARIKDKPVYGLPGHPVSAYFIFMLFVRPLIDSCLASKGKQQISITAELTQDISANHGRAAGIPVRLVRPEHYKGKKRHNRNEESAQSIFSGEHLLAIPVAGKAGMITLLSDSHGYIMIDRDCEGLTRGSQVQVLLF